MNLTKVDLSGKNVLVTGGTGFIGGRLIERLVRDCGAKVRALVRNYSRAARISRYPVEIVKSNIIDGDAVQAVVAGSDIIINCMASTDGNNANQRRVNVEGTRNLLNAAVSHKVERIVHISTINAYGAVGDGDLDETRERMYAGDVYSDSKLNAEKLAFEYYKSHQLPVSVLQPTIVFGPFGPAWTTRIINELKTGRVILVDGGSGLCNVVYVDDVVSAILLAVTKTEAIGEAFLISGKEPITWRDFYLGHAKMLGNNNVVDMPFAEAERFFRKSVKKKKLIQESLEILLDYSDVRWRVKETNEVQAMTRLARTLVPAKIRSTLKRGLTGAPASDENQSEPQEKLPPIHFSHPAVLRFQMAKTNVRIDKAQKLLGYNPAFDFEAGLNKIADWANWAGLIQ